MVAGPANCPFPGHDGLCQFARMRYRSSRSFGDVNRLAKQIIDKSTSQQVDMLLDDESKTALAVSLRSRDSLKGREAWARIVTPEKQSKIDGFAAAAGMDVQ